MVFSSNIFLFVFLPITLVLYYLIPKRGKNTFLLLASLAFYGWGEPSFVFVMIASIIANYFLGLLIDIIKDKGIRIRRMVLAVATGLNLSLLFYYKYFDFFLDNLNSVLGFQFELRNIVLPIGISFFTFQGMSYLFDLYMGKVPVQKNIIHIALYISLFPQLIAGPIVRYASVNEQIRKRSLSMEKFQDGVERFVVGLAKKVVISNQFALLADTAFQLGNDERTVLLAWSGAAAYMIQIYFDFSGYSDMAIGLGKMFGFTFLENFNYPYISTSITEFWRRWHISLSSWFRDYLYIPLGGNRRGNTYVNLFLVFLATGIWHGASWKFVLWGMYHGMFLVLERLLGKWEVKSKVPSILKWLYTMLLVMFGWVLFRANSVGDAAHYLLSMFGFHGQELVDARSLSMLLDYRVLFLIGIVAATPFVKVLCRKWKFLYLGRKVAFLGLLAIAFSFVMTGGYNPFIYFNF